MKLKGVSIQDNSIYIYINIYTSNMHYANRNEKVFHFLFTFRNVTRGNTKS